MKPSPQRTVISLKGALASVALAVSLSPSSASGQGVEVARDVRYGKAGSVELKLDVYRPRGAKRRPAVLVIHGGGWRGGDKSAWASEGRFLAENGYVAFVVNYRLACENRRNPLCGYHHPAQYRDVRRALRWIHARGRSYGADRRRVAALGGSAGAHLSLLLGTKGTGTKRVVAVVSWSAPTNLVAIAPVPVVQNYIGCSYAVCPRKYEDASPILHVTPEDAPAYLANSSRESVPSVFATEMARELTEAGVPNQLRILPGRRHSKAFAADVWPDTLRFLRRYVR